MQQFKVPWLTKKSIAAAAAGVITDYEKKIQGRIRPPIPVEKIIERGLGLRLAFYDLRKKLKLDDVLGATYVNERMICVDSSLTENRNEGRLCFTFAHEAGHWVLHRNLVAQACRTGEKNDLIRHRYPELESTGTDGSEPVLGQNLKTDVYGLNEPNALQHQNNGFIFCRVRDAKKPIEWQADYFASCMLMPEAAVKNAFCQCYGSKPLMLYNLRSAFSGPLCFDPCVETWPKIAGAVKEAGDFSNVSKQAMIIRLQDLGLVKNETRAKLSWRDSLVMT